MGGSGTGKTTLLNLLGGRLRPDAGEVIVDGLSVPALKTRELFALRKRLGMLFQTGALLTDLNVFENVAFPVREHTRLPEALIHHLVLTKLELVGLRGARDADAGRAVRRHGAARGAGARHRLRSDDDHVRRALHRPGSDLDGVIVKLIRSLNDALGMTSIVVTHDVAETCTIADYAYLVGDGQIIAEGPRGVMQNSSATEVRQFMDGLPDGPVPYHYPAGDYHRRSDGGGVMTVFQELGRAP
jgi:phospholipid/cholesterol/gamma-HCH transport system ATP-binding protein